MLLFIALGTRRVYLAGCTSESTTSWVAQQARQLSWAVQDERLPLRFLIHDRDAKFPMAFDPVFTMEAIEIIRTPYRAPRANAFAERWVRSVREACLDHLLIVSEAHPRRVLTAYVAYYNHARPHQGIDQQCPVPLARSRARDSPIERRDILRGVLHDYFRRAA